MASFLFWFFSILLSIIAGAVATILIYGAFIFLRDTFFFKKGIPKDKKKIQEYIKDNPEKFEKTNPGKPLKEDKDKELENGKRERAKFREFEKLRRAERLRGVTARSPGEGKPNNSIEGTRELSERRVLQNEFSTSNNPSIPGNGETKRKVRLDG